MKLAAVEVEGESGVLKERKYFLSWLWPRGGYTSTAFLGVRRARGDAPQLSVSVMGTQLAVAVIHPLRDADSKGARPARTAYMSSCAGVASVEEGEEERRCRGRDVARGR